MTLLAIVSLRSSDHTLDRRLRNARPEVCGLIPLGAPCRECGRYARFCLAHPYGFFAFSHGL
jgi:hypothetical protein